MSFDPAHLSTTCDDEQPGAAPPCRLCETSPAKNGGPPSICFAVHYCFQCKADLCDTHCKEEHVNDKENHKPMPLEEKSVYLSKAEQQSPLRQLADAAFEQMANLHGDAQKHQQCMRYEDRQAFFDKLAEQNAAADQSKAQSKVKQLAAEAENRSLLNKSAEAEEQVAAAKQQAAAALAEKQSLMARKAAAEQNAAAEAAKREAAASAAVRNSNSASAANSSAAAKPIQPAASTVAASAVAAWAPASMSSPFSALFRVQSQSGLVAALSNAQFSALQRFLGDQSLSHPTLLYRATRDGFAAKDFWRTCAGKPKTLTIVKVKSNGSICGAYTPVQWPKNPEPSSGWVQDFTGRTCLFSLVNAHGVPIKLRLKLSGSALNPNARYGATFGDLRLAHLDKAADAADGCSAQAYAFEIDFAASPGLPAGLKYDETLLAGASHFAAVEIEVWQLSSASVPWQ